MNAASRSFRLFVYLASASLLNACSLFSDSTKSAEYSASRKVLQARREQNFQSNWRGKSYNALLENFGAPQMLMNVPGKRALPTAVAVYGVMDNLSQCIDAFTLVSVHEGKVIIADYFCR